MKISKITLKNVKCFLEETISLEKEDTGEALSVCAFVGANGSGKSAILKAVVAAFSASNGDYAGELLDDEAISYQQDDLKVGLSLQLNEEECSYLKYGGREFELEYRHFRRNTEREAEDFLFVPSGVDQNPVFAGVEKKEPAEVYVGILTELLLGGETGLIMYYDPFRFVSRRNPVGPNIQQEQNAKSHALASNIGKDGENLYRDVELKQWMVNMDYIRLKEPTERNMAIYHHMIRAFELLLHPLKFETINQEGCLIFENEKENQKITIDMLSDGFKSIFSIALDIIRRLALAPDDKDHLFYEKEAVVLIDELDCHIHPKWQRKLLPAFRELFPNCQFIVTTHSPYILDGLQPYEIKKIGEKSIL